LRSTLKLRIIPCETDVWLFAWLCTREKATPREHAGKCEYRLSTSILNLSLSLVHPSRHLSSCNYSVSQS